MNTSSDAAEQIVRISLQGFEVTAKVAGSGAKDIAALIVAVMKDKTKTKGKTNLTNMLKSGKELKVFSIREEELSKFSREADRYGVLYCAINKKKTKDGIVDILVKTEDAPKINRIVQRFNLSRYNEIAIRSSIEKSQNKRNENQITVKTKNMQEISKDNQKEKPTKKEENTVNPRLAKTVKDPLSKPSSKMQENSGQGTSMNRRKSVKKKLESAKLEVRNRDRENTRNKSDKIIIVPSKSKDKSGKSR